MPPPDIVEPDHTQQSGPRQLQLVIHAGPLAGKGFPITGHELTFGRDPDNNIVLNDTEVSRHHARLIVRQNQVVLEDLGSTNGTLVNGQRISGEHVLQPADIISIGTSVLGVKGFSAPKTVGITQVSGEKPPFLTYPPAPATIHQSPKQAKPATPQPSSSFNLLTVGVIATVIFIILVAAAITAWLLTRNNGPAITSVPQAVITAPAHNSQIRVNQPVTIQTTATDAAGITRVELWISGQKMDEATSPAPQGQPTLTASFQWTPPAPGSYTIEIRPYNNTGTLGTPALITVNAVPGPETPPQTPTATFTPPPPTATVPTSPLLITKTDLNVRAGPDLDYDILGLLTAETQATLLGRSENGEWWQIAFSGTPNGVGWVSANPAYADVFNTEGLPVIPAPPLPTATPTDTPIPTDTSTATPVPPTDTPTPTSTPTTVPTNTVVIQFDVSPTTIEGGECVDIRWNISGVSAIYYQGQGVVGSGNVTDCPKETKTYQVRIILTDNTEKIEERTVTVVNPIQSNGEKSLAPNQTIDFDQGDVPGDDFIWNVSGGIRKFEIQGNVQLAPMPDISDLKNLPLSKCAAATFGVYTFIDGSDVVLDPVNELIPGRAACYKTNQGRLGKLRFPEASTDTIQVEWLTWQ